MNLPQVVDRLKSDSDFTRNLTTWHTIPPAPARYGGFPEGLNPKLVEALRARGLQFPIFFGISDKQGIQDVRPVWLDHFIMWRRSRRLPSRQRA